MLHGGEIYDKKIEYDFSVNLNPNPCHPEIKRALLDAINLIDKYPDMSQSAFRRAVSDAENHYLKEELQTDVCITPDMVIGGNGASELIMSIVRMINPREVLIPVPSFYGYRHALMALDEKSVFIREYQLQEDNDFELTVGFADEITKDTDLVIFANPNNPTGRCIDPDVLEAVIHRCNETGTAILVDECFLHLSEENTSALKYIDKCKRLFVVNAYTKLFSLPGVRLGYAVSDKTNIERLRSFLPEWNMSAFAERAGIACAEILTATDFEEKSKSLIRNERDKIEKALKVKGFRVFKSDTNYVLLYSEKNLYELLLKKGILIRDCSNFKGLKKGYFRIAVKDTASNNKLIDAINTGF